MRGYINQFVFYITEIILFISVTFCIYSLSSGKWIFDWTAHINTYDFVEKSTVFLVIYQLSVYSILSLIDSARKDAILSKISLYKLGIVKIEADQLFNEVKVKQDKFNNDISFMVNKKDRNDINEFSDLYDKYLVNLISKADFLYYQKYKLVLLEHEYNQLDLKWRLSFFLRYAKRW